MKSMPSIYLHRDSRSIADINMLDDGRALITRINVPVRSRGRGIASKILRQIISDADRLQITLILEPVPSGGLNQKQLIEWYERNHFVWTKDEIDGIKCRIMERKPFLHWLEFPDDNIERCGNANYVRGLSSVSSQRADKNKSI